MVRPLWPLALVTTFFIGWATGDVVRKPASRQQEVDHLQETVSRLEQQVRVLQARLRAKDTVAAERPSRTTGYAGPLAETDSAARMPAANRVLSAAVAEEPPSPASIARGPHAAQPRSAPPADRAPSVTAGSSGTVAPAPTVEAALDRFYRYLDVTNGPEGRERWQRARELVNELRGMGDAAAQALMQVLASGTDTEERREAARLVGTLQLQPALPVLRDIIEHDDDLLLRRAAASALRRLQSPDSVPVMERMLTHPGEDRFVRLSAAVGLADSGRPLGVTGLMQIFEESTADGRGRDIAFRALASLRDERPLPFMRHIVTSQAEPSYRLQAIRYLTAQRDQEALGALQALMQSPHEQPSIRDAAAQAYTAIRGR